MEHYIAGNDGIKTFVLELDAIGEETGPPIFCIHGLTRNHKDFAPIFDFLRNHGRKVYAIDVRGRGKSDFDPNPLNYHPGTYAFDVLNIFTQLGIKKAVFLGTSMGGIISMIIGALAPQIVAGMILNDIGPEVAEAGLARIREYIGEIKPANSWQEMQDRIKSFSISAFPAKANDEEFWKEFAERICKETENGIIFDYDPRIKDNTIPKDDTPAATLWPQFELLKNIPLAVIRGELSDILTPEIIEKMKEIHENMIISIVPQIGHAPLLDENEAKIAISAIININ